MDFNSKNFAYVTKRFGDMMKEITNGHKLYLRALSEDRPSDQPANIKADFPQLATDFQLPAELSFVTENEFSSVLRITGPVNMWLHYDVSNVKHLFFLRLTDAVLGYGKYILPGSRLEKVHLVPSDGCRSTLIRPWLIKFEHRHIFGA